MIYSGQQRRRRSLGEQAQLAFGLLGAPLAWAFHSLSIVLLVPAACAVGSSFPHWIVTGTALAVGLAALGVSWLFWRRSGHPEDGAVEDEGTTSTTDRSRSGFLSWGGVFTSIMFLLLILIETVPLAMLGACEPHP